MNSSSTNESAETKRGGGDDAVAFTSGAQGAPFSAGVLHAWLAADRKQPLVAAGISMGTLAAAAFRRAYQELEHSGTDDVNDAEVRRWRWFQKYYQAITENPVGPLWSALPDPVDFYSQTPPAIDPSVPECLSQESEDARRHYYLLIKLGVWLANLPVRLGTAATLIVMYVRRKEGYGIGIATALSLYWNLLITAIGLLFHVCRRPQWIVEYAFCSTSRRRRLRPMFGWTIYLFSLFVLSLIAGLPALVSWAAFRGPRLFAVPPNPACAIIFVVMTAMLLALIVLSFKRKAPSQPANEPPDKQQSWLRRNFLGLISSNLDIANGLLHPYQIKRALYNLFVKDAPAYVSKRPSAGDVKALFVCAALEETDQVILSEEMSVVDAIAAAVAISGLLPPRSVPADCVATQTKTHPHRFQVIDGAAVRTNPLPAFFDWCKHNADDELRSRLQRPDGVTPSLHVVYSVPASFDGSVQNADRIDCPDIVLSAQKALQLARRRDTRQEVRQTNNLSRLEWHRRQLPGSPGALSLLILADEIAPRKEIKLGNALAPDHTMLRTSVCDGCRTTLETLYRDEIRSQIGSLPELPCGTLLRQVAARRGEWIDKRGGQSTVCDHCTGMLQYRPPKNPNHAQEGVIQDYGQTVAPTPQGLAEMFPQLAGKKQNEVCPQLDEKKQNVVFLGSGGVFRGSFHIGVLAAMYQAKLYPDLVIGASVGTLMGGALCRITAGDDKGAVQALADLVTLFVHVDKRVALTYTLKNAAKQLGIRARQIKLSPSELARMVRKGSKADAGYAATGAPPALTDALSYLFTIPHLNTAAITAKFVSGHFSGAVAEFWREVRRETLASFNIQTSVMGVSLLEGEVRKLLAFSPAGAELNKVQPFQDDTLSRRQTAFFGTTSFLNGSSSLLLGRDFLSATRSWSTTQGTLCSSAFPAVFAPRTEADLMPGVGRADRFFADGGMFDNLPFFPTIEVLSAIQSGVPFQDAECLRKRLRHRTAWPNLIISAGLNETPTDDEFLQADTMLAIKARASTLSYESKTKTFTTTAKKTRCILREISGRDLSNLSAPQQEFLNSYVAATVISITPADTAHINPTFAFCKSLGLNRERVQASIANGCFRSLEQFFGNKALHAKLRSSNTLVTVRPIINPGPPTKKTEDKVCPYFMIDSKVFQCPFTQTNSPDALGVYEVCSRDLTHRSLHIGLEFRVTERKRARHSAQRS